MKKHICIVAALLALFLAACSSQPAASSPAPATITEIPAAPAPETPAPAPDLTGEWKQSTSDSETYHAATITADAIQIYWINTEKETKALYWAGSFTPPADASPYAWESVNDTEQTAHALLASNDESKTFTYADGEISYEASAMGVTKTVRLQKIS